MTAISSDRTNHTATTAHNTTEPMIERGRRARARSRAQSPAQSQGRRHVTKAGLAALMAAASILASAVTADAHTGPDDIVRKTTTTTTRPAHPDDIVRNTTTTTRPAHPDDIVQKTTTTRPQGPGDVKAPGGGDDDGIRPIGPSGKPILTGQPPRPGSGSDCFVDFDDKSILNILPDHAQATFVQWPFWNQRCGYGNEGNISIQPIDESHYHLGYEDEQIDFCADIGNFGRHTEPRPANPTDDELLDWYLSPCTEIDPVAETRSAIQPHDLGASTKIFTYESLGGPLPFTLNEIEIVSGTSELCYLPSGPIEAAGPGGSPWDCLELDPGYYDVSGFADDVIEVRVTALTANNAIDNIAVDIL